MIMERGARPDVDPKLKRGGGGRAALIATVALMVGLALGLGLGVGLGGDFALVGAFGTKRVLTAITFLSSQGAGARDRWRCNSVSEYDDAPTPEEMDELAVRWRTRYAEPKWGAP